MSQSKNGEKKPKELSKIVLEMLVDNEPKENIIESLKGSGLDEEEAEEVFKKVSKEYHEYVSQELKGEIEELFNENKEELVDRFGEKVKETLEETELRIDLRFSEIKEEVDSRVDSVEEETDKNRERVKQLRKETERGYKQLKKTVDSLKLKGVKSLIPMGASLIGLVIIIYSIQQTPISKIYEDPSSTSILPLSITILGTIAGLILVYIGLSTFFRKRRLKTQLFTED